MALEKTTKINLNVRELQLNDIGKVVDYFVNSDVEFLKGMGADKNKFLKREEWVEKLKVEFKKPYTQKKIYYIIWLMDNQPIGHSNVNSIEFGESAIMHLHLWKSDKRKNGLGLEFLKLTIPYYFEHLKLEKLICEPYLENVAPNKTLEKLGFELVRTYDTIPGWINFRQTVNRFELKNTQLEIIKNDI